MPIILAIVLIIGSALTGGIVAYQRLYIPQENQTVTQTVTPTPTEVISPTPILQGKTQGASSVDTDPLVNCNIHSNCGGGTISLKKSICDKSVCCQVGNTWIFYHDKAKCTQDQRNYLETQHRQVNPGVTISEPIVACVFSWGTYQLPKSVCDGYKNSPQITPYPDPANQQIEQMYLPLQNETSNTSNQQNNSQCKNDAIRRYQEKDQQANFYGGSTGTGDFIRRNAQEEYARKVAECDRLYPL